MKRPNPIHPNHLSPKERVAEVCRLLAGGLVRLRARNGELSAPPETFAYTNRPANAVMRTPTHEEDA